MASKADKKKTDAKKSSKPTKKRTPMSPDTVMAWRRGIAGVLALVGVIALISVCMYFIGWRSVENVVPVGAENTQLPQAGVTGKFLARLLVRDWFGIAALGLIAEIALLVYSLIRRKGTLTFSVVKLSALILSATFLSSVILGLCDVKQYFFTTGLGGGIGHSCAALLRHYIGFIPAALLLFALVVAWVSCTSSSFFHWITNVGADRTVRDREESVESEEIEEPVEEVLEEDEEEETQEEPAEEEETIETVEEVSDEDAADETEEGVEVVPEGEGLEGVNITTIEGKIDTNVTEELPWIDPRAELTKYRFPELTLLETHKEGVFKISDAEKNENIRRIIEAFANFKIEILDVTAIVGPTVTLYQLHHGKSVTVNSIKNRSQDIAIALGMDGVRVIVQGGMVGIEVPNKTRSIVPLRATLNSDEFRNSKAELPIGLGYTITQKEKVFDLCDAPHLLVAGATQQGKSVGLNVIITSLLYAKHPSELKFVFIDPKQVEFTAYKRLYKHYLAVLPGTTDEAKEKDKSIITKPDDAFKVLQSLCKEMDDRFSLLADAGVPKITLYNKKYQEHKLDPRKGHKYLPYIVTVVDEYADLTMAGGSSQESRKTAQGITDSIIRLAQKGRAAGIHVILATQSPRVQVVTGLIKSNFPTRIAFRVSSAIDSMTILGQIGAEKLIGKGDMLYYAGMSTDRVQCAFISNDEIDNVTKCIEKQNRYQECYAHPYYLPEIEEENKLGDVDMSSVDAMFADAATTLVKAQTSCSVTFLQRKLGIGYARAAKIMDQLEAAGVVGPQDGAKPRQILIEDLETLQPILDLYA